MIGSGIDPHNYTRNQVMQPRIRADLIVLIGKSTNTKSGGKVTLISSEIIELAEVPNVHLIAYEDTHDDHEDDAHHDDEHR